MNDHNHPRAEDVDLKILRVVRDLIVSAVWNTDYPSGGVFLSIAHAVIGALLAGMAIPVTQRSRRVLLDRISTDSERKHSATCAEWNQWSSQLNIRTKERKPRTMAFNRSWFPAFLQTDLYSIDEDFKLHMGRGFHELTLVGPRGRIVKIFQHPEELVQLGLALLDVSARINVETGSVPETDLDQSVAEAAINRINHLMKHGVDDAQCDCDTDNPANI